MKTVKNGSISGEEIRGWMKNCQLLKKDSAAWSKLPMFCGINTSFTYNRTLNTSIKEQPRDADNTVMLLLHVHNANKLDFSY